MMNVKVPILISLGGGSRGGSVKEQRRLRCAPSCQGQREQAEDGGCLNAFQLHILLKYVKAASVAIFKIHLSLNLPCLMTTMP